MADNYDTTTKFKVDISELKSAMQEAKRQVALANSEFKAVSSSMEDWTKSSDGLSAKLKQLSSNLESQEKVLNSLESQYELVVKEMGEGSKEADNLKIKINNQQAVINNTKSEIKKYETALDDLSNSEGKAGDESDELGDSLEELKDSSNEAKEGFTVFKGVLADLVASAIKEAISTLKDLSKAVVEVGSNFSSSMSEVQAISGASADDLARLEETAREFGATTVFSASESADALKYMALAGWSVDESIDALGGVLNLASASGMGLAQASDMVTDYLSAFGMEADEAGYFADLLAYAQSNANTTAEQLGEAYKNAGANLSASGQDIETVTSLLASMANQGLKGSEAGTALSAMMRDITRSMEDGAISIGGTSIAVQDSEGNFRDLTDILADVERATIDMGDAERANALYGVFTANSIKGVNLVLNEGVASARDFEWQLRGASVSMTGFEEACNNANLPLNDMRSAFESAGISSEQFDAILKTSAGSADLLIDGLKEVIDPAYDVDDILNNLGISIDDLQGAMDSSSGSAEQMSKIMNNNLSGDVKAFKSALEELALKVYDRLEPSLRDIVAFVQELATAFNEWLSDPANKQAIDDLGAKLTEFVEGALTFVLDALKWFIENKDSITAGLKAIGAGFAVFKIAGLITGLVTAFTTLGTILGGLFTAIKGGTAIMTALNTAFGLTPVGLITTALTLLVGAFVYLWNTCEPFKEFWLDLWENVKEFTGIAVDKISEFFTVTVPEALDKMIGFFKELPSKVKEWLTNTINKVSDWAGNMKTKATETAKNFIDNIINKIKNLPNDVKSWLTNTINKVSDWSSDMKNKATETAKGFLDNVINKVKQLPDDVKSWLTNVVSKVSEWAGDLKTKATEAGGNILNSVIDKVKSIPDEAKSWFDQTVSKVKDWADDLGTKAKDAGKSIFNNVVDNIKNLPSEIKTIGKNLIEGLWNGINDMASWIKEKISSFGEGILEDLKDFFGIHSPSRLMRDEIGKWIPAGIAVGIDNNAKSVLDSMRDLTTMTVEATRDGLNDGVSSGFGGVVNNFYQTNNSPKSLSRLEIYRQTHNLLGYAGGGF